MGGDPGRRRSRSRPPRDAIRGDRERKIRGIITERPVGTQEEMAAALRRQGLAVTQATVSRDIKRLGLVKAPSRDGRSRYVLPDRPSPVDVLRRLRTAVAGYVLSVDSGESVVVVHTLTGCANVVAEAIDEMRWDDVVGTVAGDNTILVVPRRGGARERVLVRLRRLVEGRPE